MKQILACIDGSDLSNSVVEYGIFLSRLLDLSLGLLNVIEPSNLSRQIMISGSIGYGVWDEIYSEIDDKDKRVKNSSNILEKFKNHAIKAGASEVFIVQKDGNLEEVLDGLANQTHAAVIGLRTPEDRGSCAYIEDVVRSLNIPILMVNGEFRPIKSVLMAYDGSEFARKSIKVAIQNPVLPRTKRYIANVSKDALNSKKLLDEAKAFFDNSDYEVETKSINDGEPVDEILKYQNEIKADIIAMGAFGKNRLRTAIFGSFTTKMLKKVKTPILFFR
ncbi:MAG: universal stress protein [Campylobacter sp.]|nr:universal stress protein [Campylobacter sp.]